MSVGTTELLLVRAKESCAAVAGVGIFGTFVRVSRDSDCALLLLILLDEDVDPVALLSIASLLDFAASLVDLLRSRGGSSGRGGCLKCDRNVEAMLMLGPTAQGS